MFLLCEENYKLVQLDGHWLAPAPEIIVKGTICIHPKIPSKQRAHTTWIFFAHYHRSEWSCLTAPFAHIYNSQMNILNMQISITCWAVFPLQTTRERCEHVFRPQSAYLLHGRMLVRTHRASGEMHRSSRARACSCWCVGVAVWRSRAPPPAARACARTRLRAGWRARVGGFCCTCSELEQ